MFGKKPGGSGGVFGLAQDGSFMLFGCLAALFVLMAAPLLALVIVSREGLAALASNIAGAFVGDRLWILTVVIVAGVVVRYAIAGPLVSWLTAREMARQEQVHYPPASPVTVESNRGYSSMEVKQLMEIMQQQARPAAALPDEKPSRLAGHQVPRRWLGGPPAGSGQENAGIGWRR